MQRTGLSGTPVQMFDRDLTEQNKNWRATGERVVLLMDVNADPLKNNLYKNIGGGPEGMQEFSHTCWGPTLPHTHARGSGPIDGGYKSPEIEIVNLSMLTFADSPGDHRSLILDIIPVHVRKSPPQNMQASEQTMNNCPTFFGE